MYRDKEKQKAYMKQWQKDNPEKVAINNKKAIKKYRITHSDKIAIYYKKYNQEHKTELNKKRREKNRTDLKYNLSKKISRVINMSLKGNKNGRCWEDLVGYTVIDLFNHLKKTMPEGYSWQDYLDGKLELDHKIPKSVFNFTKPEHIDFKRCWSLSNLRLLPAKTNRVKYNKLYKPFQPALLV